MNIVYQKREWRVELSARQLEICFNYWTVGAIADLSTHTPANTQAESTITVQNRRREVLMREFFMSGFAIFIVYQRRE